MPTEMTAIGMAAPGGPEVLVPQRRPVPAPGPDEVLIKVAAAGINRPDVMQRLGKYPPPPGAPDIPGLEVSGTIVAAGGSAELLIGRRELGRASCRERVCQDVSISVVAVTLKKKRINKQKTLKQ